MTFSLSTTLSSFLYNFGENQSYHCWHTAIFVNSDLDLHFQEQMITCFFCYWLRCHHYGRNFIKIGPRIAEMKEHLEMIPLLWPSYDVKVIPVILFNSPLFYQTYRARMTKTGGIMLEIFDVFTRCMQPIFHLEKEDNCAANTYYLTAFVALEYIYHNLKNIFENVE